MAIKRLTDAQRDLVADNIKLAKSIAKRASDTYGERLSFGEALSGASLGMIANASKFDPKKGKFSTSCYQRARGQILDDLRSKFIWMTGKRSGAVKRQSEQFAEDKFGRTDEERLASPEEMDELEQADTIEHMLKKLSKNEQHIVRRVVLDGATLTVAGSEIGISESGACYVKREALKKLRQEHGEYT